VTGEGARAENHMHLIPGRNGKAGRQGIKPHAKPRKDAKGDFPAGASREGPSEPEHQKPDGFDAELLYPSIILRVLRAFA